MVADHQGGWHQGAVSHALLICAGNTLVEGIMKLAQDCRPTCRAGLYPQRAAVCGDVGERDATRLNCRLTGRRPLRRAPGEPRDTPSMRSGRGLTSWQLSLRVRKTPGTSSASVTAFTSPAAYRPRQIYFYPIVVGCRALRDAGNWPQRA
jgi:hypothetical protein